MAYKYITFPEESLPVLGANIKAERKRLGLSMEALGDKVGLGREAISSIEHARNKGYPELEGLLSMCAAFNCDLEYLLGFQEERIRGHVDFSEITGLDPSTIERIAEGRYESEVINYFLNHPSWEEFIARISEALSSQWLIIKLNNDTKGLSLARKAFKKAASYIPVNAYYSTEHFVTSENFKEELIKQFKDKQVLKEWLLENDYTDNKGNPSIEPLQLQLENESLFPMYKWFIQKAFMDILEDFLSESEGMNRFTRNEEVVNRSLRLVRGKEND